MVTHPGSDSEISYLKNCSHHCTEQSQIMNDTLFSTRDLSITIDSQERSLAEEIGALNEHQVLQTSTRDLCKYFVDKHTIYIPKIDEENIQVDYGDAESNSRRPFGNLPDHAMGTRITFYVPFAGNSSLFSCRPKRRRSDPPHAVVSDTELTFVYQESAQQARTIKNKFDNDIENTKWHLSQIAHDVKHFNANLAREVSQKINTRRDKLLLDINTVAHLGFPIRKRDNIPTTFVTSAIERKPLPEIPKPSPEPFKPEPTIDTDDYKNILQLLSNMGTAMERSPAAFKGMKEEHLRTFFLVILNSQYNGQATGETFNYEGKTDILVRVNGKNVFIAECKFWTGASGLKNAIDQLLGYTTWRDTKTTLLIFNREIAMTTVLDQIPKTIKDHPNCKAEQVPSCETEFRYIFGHRDDSNRELILTVLVFDVPK